MHSYTVQPNDTPEGIARRFTGNGARAIELVANNAHKPRKSVGGTTTFQGLTVGETLKIPAGWVSHVAPQNNGDSGTPPSGTCPPGYVDDGTGNCVPSSTGGSTSSHCSPGYVPNPATGGAGVCVPIGTLPPCPPGMHRNMTTGQCGYPTQIDPYGARKNVQLASAIADHNTGVGIPVNAPVNRGMPHGLMTSPMAGSSPVFRTVGLGQTPVTSDAGSGSKWPWVVGIGASFVIAYVVYAETKKPKHL